MMFAKVISNISHMKKPLIGGEKIPDGTSWKEFPLTRILKSMFDGSAYSTFVFCMSQHPRNGGESYSTMEFSNHCNNMKVGIKRLPPKNLNAYMKSL